MLQTQEHQHILEYCINIQTMQFIIPLYNTKILNQLTFTPLPSYGFAFYQIGCDFPLELQVLPKRPQLQVEVRDIKHSMKYNCSGGKGAAFHSEPPACTEMTHIKKKNEPT